MVFWSWKSKVIQKLKISLEVGAETKYVADAWRSNEDFCSLCDFSELKIRDIEADLQPEKTITSRVRDIIRDDLLCELEHYDQKIKKI